MLFILKYWFYKNFFIKKKILDKFKFRVRFILENYFTKILFINKAKIYVFG
jgi:hypothetical protein